MDFTAYELRKISDALNAIKDVDETNNGWKQAALAWQYLFELAIIDDIEEFLKTLEKADFVQIQQKYDSKAGIYNQLFCKITIGGKTILGTSSSSLINAIKDAKTLLNKSL